MGACHFIGTVLVHHLRPADHCADGQRRTDSFSQAEQIGHYFVKLKAPKDSAAAEPGLDLIEAEQRAVPIAPLAQGLGIGLGHEIGTRALVGLRNHAGDVARIDVPRGQRGLENPEAGVFTAEPVRERNLYNFRIEVLIHVLPVGDPPICCAPIVRP